MSNPGEVEIYFPYGDTYIEARLLDYSRTFKLKCVWTHYENWVDISLTEMPLSESQVMQRAIAWYEALRLWIDLGEMGIKPSCLN